MTRERAKELAPIIAAYGEGKDIQVFRPDMQSWVAFAGGPWALEETYRIAPEPKMRPMTRNEVLAFCARQAHQVVVRWNGGGTCGEWVSAQCACYESVGDYEWAYIEEDGTIGEPHKFEVAE